MKVQSSGVLLTLKEIRLILHAYAKGHPLRRLALRDVATYRRYATDCGKQGRALLAKR